MSWTPLEFAANFMTVLCIFLAGRNNVHTWWTGIVACILFGALFFQAQLYADVTLQAFFVVTGIIGWYSWVASRKQDSFNKNESMSLDSEPLPITRVSLSTFWSMFGVAVLAAVGYGTILKMYTNAFAPMIDSLVLTFSVIAQLLLMRRKLETWPLWVIVNTLAVPLFYSRELYLTSALYAVFWVHALWAWNHWAKLKAQAVPSPSNKIWN